MALASALKPKKLGPRGNAIWKAMTEAEEPDAMRAVLLAELCRMADRLEQLNRLISGDPTAWVHVTLPRQESADGEVVLNLRVDGLYNEARQTLTTMRQTITQLKSGGGGEVEQTGASFLDAIAQSTADRFAAAAAQ